MWGKDWKVCKEEFYCSLFTRLVEQLPRRIWDVIGLVYDKWERPGDKPKFWGHGPVLS